MSYVMASPVSTDLAQRIFAHSKEVRANPVQNAHTDTIVELIHDVSKSTMDFYFIEPLEMLHIGPFGRKLVHLGINTGLGLVKTTSKKLFRTLSGEQLLKFTDWVEQMILPTGDGVYSLTCPLTEDEAQSVFDVAQTIRNNPQPQIHTGHAVEVIVETSEITLHYFSIAPLDMLNVGAFGKKIVNIAVRTGIALIQGTCRKLIDKLPSEDLLGLADFLEGLIKPIHKADAKKA